MKALVDVSISHGVDPDLTDRYALAAFDDWECEPRGIVGFLQGLLQAFNYEIGNERYPSSTITVKLVFVDEIDDEDEEYDELIFSGTIYDMITLLKRLIENQSSKCLTWACVEQVAEEIDSAKRSH